MARPKNNYETDKLVFQVPKDLKESLKTKLKPIIKKEVKKWKKDQILTEIKKI